MAAHLIDIDKFQDERGTLGVVDSDIFQLYNFVPRRVFYVTGVKRGGERGAHAHIKCTQIIFRTSGLLSVDIKTPIYNQTFELNDNNLALLVPPMHWGVQYGFSENTSYVVLADREYIEEEYIRDYSSFQIKWNDKNES